MRLIAPRFAFVLFIVSTVAMAQGPKAGLWETTTTITYQQTPFPSAAAGAARPHMYRMCVTQEQIEKFGAPTNSDTEKMCHVANVIKSSNGMTADLECSGRMNGKGTLKASWNDPNHVTGTSHFAGTFQSPQGGNVPIEWNSSSTSDYKGAACGAVKPGAMSQ